MALLLLLLLLLLPVAQQFRIILGRVPFRRRNL
jgi:hypothetical protein